MHSTSTTQLAEHYSREHFQQEVPSTILHTLTKAIEEMTWTKEITQIEPIANRIVRKADIPDFARSIPRLWNRIIGRGKQHAAGACSRRPAVLVDIASPVGQVVGVANEDYGLDRLALGAGWRECLEDLVGYCCA